MYQNYRIIKQAKIDDFQIDGCLLEHNKTKAKVLLLQSDDDHLAFGIAFRTPPSNDSGIPHIIEHSVLCGSRKYPVKDPFVELMKSSLNTFLNAITYADRTVYPIASCNLQDFKNLMDIYLDAVFFPNILHNKKLFMQEGWHYELDNPSDELKINGVVYNEMKGAYSTPDQYLTTEIVKALYPNNCYGLNSGGDPLAIPSLSYEEFIKYYKTYYHPSNSYIFIYGNCDMEERLNYLDKEYLSLFDYQEINSKIIPQKPLQKTVKKNIPYPLSEEQSKKNNTYLTYNLLLPETITLEERYAIDIILNCLVNESGSVLSDRVLDLGLGEYVKASTDMEILQPSATIYLKGSNLNKAQKFISTVDDIFRKVLKTGINKKELLATINLTEFKLKEADYGGTSKGLISGFAALNTWIYDDTDVFSWGDVSKIFKELKSKIDTDYFQQLIEKYFINNKHKAFINLYPDKTLQKKRDKAQKKKMANLKKAMNKDEILKIIKENQELKKYQEEDDSEEALKTIPLLTKKDLSYEVLPLSNNVEVINGIKVIHHDFQTNGIGYYRLLFNIENLPNHLLESIGLLRSLLGTLSTKHHHFYELNQEISIYTGGINCSLYNVTTSDNLQSYFTVNGSVMDENIEKAIDLTMEIITETEFKYDTHLIECLNIEKGKMENRFSNSGNQVALTRSNTYHSYSSYLYDLEMGIGYYQELIKVLKKMDVEVPLLVKRLEEVVKYIFTKDNLLISFTGSSDGYQEFKKQISKITSKLPNKENKTTPAAVNLAKKNEGFMTPYNVNYVALSGNFMKDNLKYSPSLVVLQNILNAEYLWKKVRVLGGAYGVGCGFDLFGNSYFVSYRDPNINETLKAYQEIPNYIRNATWTEDDITKYVIGAIGSVDYPLTPLQKGRRSLSNYLMNRSIEEIKKHKAQIIDTTLQDIKNLTPIVESIIKQNNICVIGNENDIIKDKTIFNETKQLLK